MSDPYFFGYGSLVNRRTHDYPEARPATLDGWRRVWRHLAARPTALLTAERAPGIRIDGLIAAVPGADWAALDLREAAYDRVPVRASVTTHPGPHADGAAAPPVSVYAIPPERGAAPEPEHPVLLSYLDTVVQGFLVEFGEAGVARFFDTTGGWTAPVADDRDAPLYPRAQRITAAETALVDGHLARRHVPLFSPYDTDLADRIELARRAR